jgi:chromosomal replication initiator protein
MHDVIIARDTEYFTRLWKSVKDDLLNHYGEAIFSSWFSKLHMLEADNNKILLAVPTNFMRDWIKSNYLSTIKQLWQHYSHSNHEIEVTTAANLPEFSNVVILHSGEKTEDKTQEENIGSSPLDARFTFENFVVGPPNQLAYAAAQAVAESKTAIAESNPLFLYGSVGLGKTHLMHATAWQIKKTYPERKVIYMSAEKFMYQFVRALRNKDVISFKERFRSVDVLMIDDIQFICGKDSTQEEFFHTFNALIDNNRQMVISCDRSPSDLDNVEDRIKSRLGWGLVADVHSTTYELRIGILQSKVEQMNISIPQNVIEFLAGKITSNVRELEGALNKVVAHSTLIGREITLENTREILRDLLRANERIITVEEIQKKVANRYNIKASDMSSNCRSRDIARPRQLAMYLSKILTPKSLADIGRKFGKKDHTTVIHAVKKIEELCENDREFMEEVDLLTKILQS